MMSWKMRGALLLSSALVGALLIAGQSREITKPGEVGQLFDPAYLKAGMCGTVGDRAKSTFSPALQLVLARSAQAAAPSGKGPPLFDDLGDLTYPVSTESEEAQQYFDQGLRLTYAFNHAEARRAFQQAQELDPDCAMCYWGEAFVLGPNINAPMDEGATDPSLAAVNSAKERATGASEKEQALIDALALRYGAGPQADRTASNEAYAEAMAHVHERFPDDQDIAVLFADAVMNTSPWDYWEADGRTPKGRIGEAVAAIERVLETNPDHAGAIHLYIHLVEASDTPERGEPHADRLAALMPGAGHIVHMPSHIYYRLGRWVDSLEANIAAVEADEAYLAQIDAADVHPDGVYPYGYYPHNVHFVVTSAQMAGDAKTSLEAADKLAGLIPDDVAEQVGLVHPVKVAPYFAYAQFGDPAAAEGLPAPGDELPFVKAMWHYMQGIARAAEGDLEAARTEAAQIAEIERTADLTLLHEWAVPADDVLAIARHVLAGRIAQAENDLDAAIREFEVAVQIQDTLPYMEPPYWYYPVRQSLGATLLMAGRAEDAEQMFQQTLLEAPNNGWALYGLMEAHKAQGDDVGAEQTEALLEAAWVGDRALLDLERL